MNLRRLRYTAVAAAVLVAACLFSISLFSISMSGQDGPATQTASITQTLLAWAYPVDPPPPPGPPPADDGSLQRLPGSPLALTITQVRDRFNIPDWFPNEHPPLPDIVAHGRAPDVWGCGYCHLPNAQGRPENSSLAGLPAAYIVQQIADWKNDLRKSSEPKMGPPSRMVTMAKAANDAEVKIAAEYFASLKFKQWIRVVESNTVPKTRPAGGMLHPVKGGGTEPIGQRIIETPEDVERTELRDPSSGFIAYVPVGSIKKGEALVTTGGAGKTIRCGICHGADLKGLAQVPPLAGRSPSYVARQLHDMQSGARKGPWAELMKEAVAKLTVEDIVAIAAYTSSRTP